MGRLKSRLAAYRDLAARLRSAIRGHWLFILFLAGGIVIRVLVAYGFRPILWFLGDSISYLDPAVGGPPFALRPDGYSVFLLLLRPLHRLSVVAIAQHALGLGIAVLVYGVCLRIGLPRWLAAVAAFPTLFDAWQITIEQMLVSETAFTFLIMSGFALTVWWRNGERPPLWAVGLAGLLIGASADLKSSGEFLIVPVVLTLLLRRVGWRRVTAAICAFLVPLIAYAGWFDRQFGWFGLSPGGLFAYGRVAMFADCTHDSLSRAEQAICPSAAEKAHGISWVIWDPASPYNHLPGGLHYKTTLAEHFAVSVARQQPGSYVSTVAGELQTEFSPIRHKSVPDTAEYDVSPRYAQLPYEARYYAALYQHGGDGQPHPISWIAHFFRDYQLRIHIPGLGFLAGVLVTIAGFAFRRHRGFAGARADLACYGLAAVTMLVLPVLVATFDYRYLVPVLPPLSVAVAVAVHSLMGRDRVEAARTADAPFTDATDGNSTTTPQYAEH